VHLPKAGGTSMLKTLRESDVNEFLTEHYSDDPVDPDSQTNQNPPFARETATKLTSSNNYVIYGHFAPRIFLHTNFEDLITIIRHPIPWAISLYNFWSQMRTDGEAAHGLFKEFCDRNLTLIELLELPPIQKIYSQTYLSGVDPSDFSFIGNHEKYSEAVEKVGEIFGVKLNENKERIGNYKNSKAVHRGDLKLGDRIKINKLLKSEIDLYNQYVQF
jgi:hypothetical protein